VTLSDDELGKMLRREFVCGWVNTDNEAASGGSFAHDPEDAAGTLIRGNGRSNLQMLLITPEGGILHAVLGHADAPTLRTELEYALRTFALAKKAGELAKQVVEQRQRDRAFKAPPPRPRSTSTNEQLIAGAIATNANLVNCRARDFVADNPLLPIAKFRTQALTGETSGGFFGACSGGMPGETIGQARIPKRVRDSQVFKRKATKPAPGEESPPRKRRRPSVIFHHRDTETHRAIPERRAPAGHRLLDPVAVIRANDLSRNTLRSKGSRSGRPTGWIVGG
jgi:hypothetical protein